MMKPCSSALLRRTPDRRPCTKDVSREAVESKDIRVSYCNTEAMLADLMTKPLPQHAHTTLTRLVLGGDSEVKPYKFKNTSPKTLPSTASTSLRFGPPAA